MGLTQILVPDIGVLRTYLAGEFMKPEWAITGNVYGPDTTNHLKKLTRLLER